jgi:hypothetical protein
VEENAYRDARLRLMQGETRFVSSDVKAANKKRAIEAVEAIVSKLQEKLLLEGSKLMKKQCRFFSDINGKLLQQLYDAELKKVEDARNLNEENEIKKRSFKDEFTSLPVYQAILNQHPHDELKHSEAEQIRSFLIEFYRKHNVSRVRNLKYVVDSFLNEYRSELKIKPSKK